MAPHEPSPGELADRLDRLEDNLSGLVGDVKTQLTRMEDRVVWRDTYQSDQRSTNFRLTNIEDRQRWTWRAAITGIVLPLVVLVVGAIIVANMNVPTS